jgi:hypothetical protein
MTETQVNYLGNKETILQAALVDALLAARALVIRVNSGRAGYVSYNRWTVGGGWQTAGVSDLIAVMPDGEVLFIECKATGGQYTVMQVCFRAGVLARGGKYLTIEETYRYLAGDALDTVYTSDIMGTKGE